MMTDDLSELIMFYTLDQLNDMPMWELCLLVCIFYGIPILCFLAIIFNL